MKMIKLFILQVPSFVTILTQIFLLLSCQLLFAQSKILLHETTPCSNNAVIGTSGYFGGMYSDIVYDMCIDRDGYIYLTGETTSPDFPVLGAVQPARGGGYGDAFITKLKPDGREIVFSTFIGGSDADAGNGIDVDNDGNIVITGNTSSKDFPIVNPLQKSPAGGATGDAFVLKLNASGTKIIFSTFWGGSGGEISEAAVFDGNGDIIVAGGTFSQDFPVKNAFQDKSSGGMFPHDAFISKFSKDGQTCYFSTYLGGACTMGNHAADAATDVFGNIYVTGYTCSSSFPVLNPLQSSFAGVSDVFLSKFNSSGNMIFSTYLGGSQDDKAYSLTTDDFSNIYITGYTTSADYPMKNPVRNKAGVFDSDIFITKIKSSGQQLIFSTYLGGTDTDQGKSIAVDNSGNVFVTGYSISPDFYAVNKMQSYNQGIYPPYRSDAIAVKLNSAGSAFELSTHLGGDEDDEGHAIAVNSSGCIFIAGMTESAGNFPVKNALMPAYQGGDHDGFLSSITEGSLPCPASLRYSLSGNQVHLIWNAPSAPEIKSYNIYRSTATPVVASSYNHIGNCVTTFYTDQLMMTGNIYYYAVTAVYNDGESLPSNEVQVSFTHAETIDETVPANFSMSDNYPNPFNNHTIIEFSIPADCFVELSVYDQKGAIILTVVNRYLSAGRYKEAVHTDGFSSGIYLAVLKAGKFTKTKKILLLK
ncbi:MAG: SBBP repeat-containing protein [Bacteroidota bacterium]